jgi:hypothetical protein
MLRKRRNRRKHGREDLRLRRLRRLGLAEHRNGRRDSRRNRLSGVLSKDPRKSRPGNSRRGMPRKVKFPSDNSLRDKHSSGRLSRTRPKLGSPLRRNHPSRVPSFHPLRRLRRPLLPPPPPCPCLSPQWSKRSPSESLPC